MLNDLTCQVSLQQLAHSPSVLENIWLPLLHHHNLNVLQHAVAALKIWVEAYGLKNKRI